METTVKTIDINAKEWFDKIYGNSYFAAIVTINFGLEDQTEIKIPFDYGYGDYYKWKALKEVAKRHPEINGLLPYELRNNGIIIRSNIQTGCLKRDLKAFVS